MDVDVRMTLEDDIELQDTYSEDNSGTSSVGMGDSGPHIA